MQTVRNSAAELYTFNLCLMDRNTFQVQRDQGIFQVNRQYERRGASQLDSIFPEFTPDGIVLKAQVYTGGRGKAGGVKLTDNIDQAK